MQPLLIQSPRKKAPSRNKNYWQEIINVWEQSGEHPNDFCARMNIKTGTLSHWRNVFKKEKKVRENKFIELKVKPKENLLEKIVIECPSGHRISLCGTLDEARSMFEILGLIA